MRSCKRGEGENEEREAGERKEGGPGIEGFGGRGHGSRPEDQRRDVERKHQDRQQEAAAADADGQRGADGTEKGEGGGADGETGDEPWIGRRGELQRERAARAAVDPVAAANGNARAVFDLRPVRGSVSLFEIVIRAPGTERVEVMGSFTDWQPVVLSGDDSGHWRFRLALAPGLHRINVRIDGGEWIAPAGTSAMPDDFGGTVGVFVIR